jgi:hypothetical protein
MKAGDVYWQFVSQVWDGISIYDGEQVFLAQFSKANSKQQHLFAAHWSQSEIRNGGFDQFFRNSTGILAPEAVIAFRAIGMPNTAGLIEKAMRFFGSVYPRDRSTRIAALNTHAARDPLDADPFYEMDDELFKFLAEESGGFEQAADRYATLGSTD